MAKVLEVTASQDRRLRGGLVFTRSPRRIDPASLTDEQIEALENDPVLTMREVEGEPDGDPVTSGPKPLTTEEIEERVREAITALGADDYIKNGSPRMDAVRSALGKTDRGGDIALTQEQMLASFTAMKQDGFTPPTEA